MSIPGTIFNNKIKFTVAKGVIYQSDPQSTKYFEFMCPGCNATHMIPVSGDQAWEFNFDAENPTVSPSILCFPNGKHGRCHSYITDGKIRFDLDTDHKLAGKTVELPAHDEMIF